MGSELCPLTVVQARSKTCRGLPARIWTPARIGILKPRFFLNIEFQPKKPSSLITCEPSAMLEWKIDKESQSVKIASAEEEKMYDPFEIHPHRDHYKLVYCDNGSQGNSNSDVRCKDLGISIAHENNRRLVVKDGDPLVVRFVKAKRDYTRINIF